MNTNALAPSQVKIVSPGETIRIAISDMRVRDAWNVRARALVRDKIAEYAGIFDSLPPVTVWRVNNSFYLVDGWHRRAAALALGRTFITARIGGVGTETDARIAALTANMTHGMPLTAAQRRDAITAYWRIKPDATIRDVCALFHVSATTAMEQKQFVETGKRISLRQPQRRRVIPVSAFSVGAAFHQFMATTEPQQWNDSDFKRQTFRALKPVFDVAVAHYGYTPPPLTQQSHTATASPPPRKESI